MAKRVVVVFALMTVLVASAFAQGGKSSAAGAANVERVIADYTALYNPKDLEEWRKLFHSSLLVASPEADGTILVRSLKQFYGAQKKAFDGGTKMSERLQNIAIERGNRIAQAAADFVFTSNGKPSRGQLGMHLVQGKEGWKITAIVYSYKPGQEPR